MIYVRTCAYNAEKTLRRAMDSILNQTYGELTYYVLDNGSSDKTGDIIREYALNDKRVVPFFSKTNRKFDENADFWLLTRKLQENDLFCILDADDSYGLTFLQEMIPFLKENHLDIAACGTRFMNAEDGEVCGENKLEINRVLSSPSSFNQYFTEIHWNLRQVWGKIYTARAAKARYEIELPEWFPKAYGGDTVNVYECVKAGNAIGVYAKTLHSYYMSPKSVSHKWIEGREDADEVLFDKAIELLQLKCRFVSEQNLRFLYAVHYNAMKDTFQVLFDSTQNADQKLKICRQIMEKPLTQKTLQAAPDIYNKTFLQELVQGMIMTAKSAGQEGIDDCAKVFASITEKYAQLVPKRILRFLIDEMPQGLQYLVMAQYQEALAEVQSYLDLKRLQKEQKELPELLNLGLNLSAIEENEESYVKFIKRIIFWKWENQEKEEAWKELQEWMEILPEDEELRRLQKLFMESGI